MERGVLGVSKEIEHLVLEYKGEQLKTNEQQKDMCTNIRLPTLPPTLSGGVCRLAQIYYTLTVNMKSSYNKFSTFKILLYLCMNMFLYFGMCSLHNVQILMF